MTKTQSKTSYTDGLVSDVSSLKKAIFQPISVNKGRVLMIAVVVLAFVLCLQPAFAATPLFTKLKSGIDTLYKDLQEIVNVVAMLAIVISVLGIFLASIAGPKATATMVSALKYVLIFFALWQLMPLVISTIELLFGSGGTTATGTD